MLYFLPFTALLPALVQLCQYSDSELHHLPTTFEIPTQFMHFLAEEAAEERSSDDEREKRTS